MSDEAFFRSLGRAPDAAGLAFFSQANVALLQIQMRHEVYTCTGAVVGDQCPRALRSVMEAVYEDHALNKSNCGEFSIGQVPGMFAGPNVRPGVFPENTCAAPGFTADASVAELNKNVLRRIVSNVVSGVRSHRTYMNDISQANPVPLERPAYMSKSGQNSLNLNRK
jgi:hypothetical protein